MTPVRQPAAEGFPTSRGVRRRLGFGETGLEGPARRRAPEGSWASYAAAIVAFAFAGVSFYWAAGGMAGVTTLGGSIERMATARAPGFVTVVWVTAVLKLAGGVLALALARPWTRELPRRWLLRAAWGAAILLTLYGAVQTASVALLRVGVFKPDPPVDSTVLWWRLLLWEPWFLLWGILLGLAARNAGRNPAPPSANDDPGTSGMAYTPAGC